MLLSGLSSILWLVLFWIVVLLIIIAVMVIGGLLVATVSLPILKGLPAVRRHMVGFIEEVGGARIDSLTDWRFLVFYAIFVEVFGFSLFLGGAMVAEWFRREVGFTFEGPLDSFPEVMFVFLIAIGLVLIAYKTVANALLQAIVQWVVFLFVISGLALIAAIVVPTLLIYILRLLGVFG